MTPSINKLTFGTGFALVYKETFLVASVHDITQPELGFFSASENRLPRTFSAMAGRVFNQGNWRITPRVVYHRWGDFNSLDLGLNAQYKWMYVGANYNWADALGFAAGVEIKERARFSYNYTITVSRLGT